MGWHHLEKGYNLSFWRIQNTNNIIYWRLQTELRLFGISNRDGLAIRRTKILASSDGMMVDYSMYMTEFWRQVCK